MLQKPKLQEPKDNQEKEEWNKIWLRQNGGASNKKEYLKLAIDSEPNHYLIYKIVI